MKRRHLWMVAISLIIAVCMCFCLAACNSCGDSDDGKTTPVALSVPTVTLDNDGKAVWDAVENASGYAYKIGSGAEKTTDTRSVALEKGETIVVKAKGDGTNYTDSAWSTPVTRPADTPEPIELGKPVVSVNQEGKATWSAVTGASKYAYQIKDSEQAEWGADSTEITVLFVDGLTDGQVIRVKAIGDGVDFSDSAWSNPKTCHADGTVDPEPLDAPVVEIITKETTGTVVAKWNAVEGATEYSVQVKDNDAEDWDTPVTFKTCEYEIAEGQSVRVKALGDGTNYTDSDWSNTVIRPVTPPVKHDHHYVYTPNEDGKTHTGTCDSVVGECDEKTVNEPHVYDKEGNTKCVCGAEKPVLDKLGAPENLEVEIEGTQAGKVNVTWDAVENANGYKYVIGDGEPVEVKVNNATVTLADGQSIKVMAVGDGENYDDGDYCDPVTFTVDNTKTYSVAEIIPIANYYGTTASAKDFTVSGVVSENTAINATYKSVTFTLKEGNDTFKFYNAKFAEDLGVTTVAEDEYKNFTVTATGKVKVYGKDKELDQNCVVSAITMSDEDRVLYAAADLKLNAEYFGNFELPTAKYGVTITDWDSDNADAITIAKDNDSGVYTATVTRSSEDVTVKLTAHLSCGEETADQDLTVVVKAANAKPPVPLETATLTFDANKANRTSFKAETAQVWAQNGVTLTNSKASSSNNIGDYAPIRCYAGSSINVVFSIEEKTTKVVKMVFNCVNSTHAEKLVGSIGTMKGVTATQADKKVTVEFTDEYEGKNSFTVATLSAQVQLNSIDVYYKEVLPALTGLEVDVDDDGVVTWTEVTGAKKYAYQIDDGEVQYVELTAERKYDKLTNRQTIKVWAVGDDETCTDSEPVTGTYTQTTLVMSEVTIDDNGLATWTEVTGASGYEVKIGETVTPQTGLSKQLTDGDTIQVRPIGGGKYITGDYSEGKSYNKIALDIPVLTMDGAGCSWTEVANAWGYKYVINGDEDNAKTTQALSVKLTNNGDKIKVKAIPNPDGTGLYKEGEYSGEKTYSKPADPEKIPANSITVSIKSDGSITLTCAYAASFKYTINGGTEKTVENNAETHSVVLKDESNEDLQLSDNDELSVIAVPSTDDAETLKDSDPVVKKYQAAKTFDAPTPAFNVSSDRTQIDISWSAVVKDGVTATKYQVRYTAQGEDPVEINVENKLTAPIPLVATAYVKVEIKTVGDGLTGDISTGDYSGRRNGSEYVDVTNLYTDCFNDFTEANLDEIDDEIQGLIHSELIPEKVTTAIEPIVLRTSCTKPEHQHVTLSWELTDGGGVAETIEDNAKLKITPTNTPATVKITVTVTCGFSVGTKEFTISVKLAPTTYATFVFEDYYKEQNNITIDNNYTKKEISLKFSAAKYFNSDHSARYYKDATLQISSTDDLKITKIVFTGTVLASVGNNGKLDGKIWTGSATSVVFTATGTNKIPTITVTYEKPHIEPADAVNNTKTNLTWPEAEKGDTEYSYTLPTEDKDNDTTITWEFEGLDLGEDGIDDYEDGYLIVARRTTDLTFKAIATITSTEDSTKSDTKTFENRTVDKLPALYAPVVKIDADGIASWIEVDDADSYVYQTKNPDGDWVDGDEANINFDVNDSEQFVFYVTIALTDGQSIRVMAVPNDGKHSSSDWSTVKTYEAGAIVHDHHYVYTPNEDGKTHTGTCDSDVGECDEKTVTGNHVYDKEGNTKCVCGAVKPNDKSWKKVTDASQLVIGAKVLITNTDGTATLGVKQSNNFKNTSFTAKTFNVEEPGDVQVLTLAVGTGNQNYALVLDSLTTETTTTYLAAASSSNNYLKTSTSLNGNSTCTISVTSTGVATIKFTGSYTHNLIRYNSGNTPPLFSCYASGQDDISIYIYA